MIRPAEPADVAAIIELVRELARYERAEDEAKATPEQLHDALFCDRPHVWCHVAEVDGEIVGIAVWFLNFSTWLGRHGIYLEDLYVSPAHRGTGVGLELLRTLARTAVERGYGRVEWWVLDWNEPSIAFYKRIGARPMDEWTVFRLTGDPLQELAVPH